MSTVRHVDVPGIARFGRFAALATLAIAAVPAMASTHEHRSGPFAGVKVDRGTVVHSVSGGRDVLTLSDDFRIPDAPDAHWQVVDSQGTIYSLDRLVVKPEQTLKKQITVPAYVRDVAKVQMWCAYAEVLLGEATFPSPASMHASAAEPSPGSGTRIAGGR